GNGCSHDAEVKQRVTLTDPTAGCAVGRDAAGASSRQKGRRRDMWRTAFLRRLRQSQVETD
ncbi:MAG: hypothetical protein NT069_27005, partial [Planctomycetota bacterium]|nr:hypothetical protein [Planctomycetota bacterium]